MVEIVRNDTVYDEVHVVADMEPSSLPRELCRELVRNSYILNFVANYFGTVRHPKPFSDRPWKEQLKTRFARFNCFFVNEPRQMNDPS